MRDGIRVRAIAPLTSTKAFRYAAYGAVVQRLPASASPTLLGFAGELADPSGLIYLRTRWYDPGMGRFMSRDKLPGKAPLPVSLNAYGYAHANPTGNADPSGLLCVGVSFGGSGVLGSGTGGGAGTTSVGFVACGGGDRGLNAGLVGTVGAFVGGRNDPGAIGEKRGNVASGAYAGAGFAGLFSPNATQVSDFGKEFRSEAVDLGIGPVNGGVNYSSGLNAKGGAVDVIAVTPPSLSAGLGLSYSLMTTWTLPQEIWAQGDSPK